MKDIRTDRRSFIKAASLPLASAAMGGTATAASAALAHDHFADLDTVALADLVRTRQASAREIVNAAISRIELLNPQINAVIDTYFDVALKQLEQSDHTNSPFQGVPILIKDVNIEGVTNFAGSRLLASIDYRADHTDVFVKRAQAAGLTILGRTNVPEFYSAPTTEPEYHGACRNPWNLERSTGGSSGGSGAAVAAHMVSAAQASDGGGSTRIPASANGLVGLKQSRGLVSMSPSGTDWIDITTTKNWLTRSVRDLAALMDLVVGPGPGDTLVAPRSAVAFADAIKQAPKSLRIGMMAELPGSRVPVDPEAVKAVERVAAVLNDMGHVVEDSRPEPLRTLEHFSLILRYWPSKVAARLMGAEKALGRPIREGEIEPGSFQMLQYAREHSIADFAETLAMIHDYSMRVLRWFDDGYDLLLTPTTGCAAPRLGVLSQASANAEAERWAGFAPIVNITGQPAISVPLHWTDDGLPIGVQLIGNRWSDQLLVQVAQQLEDAMPWAHRRPKVSA